MIPSTEQHGTNRQEYVGSPSRNTLPHSAGGLSYCFSCWNMTSGSPSHMNVSSGRNRNLFAFRSSPAMSTSSWPLYTLGT